MNARIATGILLLLIFQASVTSAGRRRQTVVDLPDNQRYSWKEALDYVQSVEKLPAGVSFRLLNSSKDPAGITHSRYIQTYQSYDVKGAVWMLHSRSDAVFQMNGFLISEFASLQRGDEQQALAAALQYVGAKEYKWQVAQEEARLRKLKHNQTATWYPAGRLLWVSPDKMNGARFELCYEFNIYAHNPLSRQLVDVSVASGKVIAVEDLLHEVNNKSVSALTMYSGARTIVTDSVGPGDFELHDDTRGPLIATYNMQTTRTNPEEFTSANNTWSMNNANLDQYAIDAHWGAEMTIDYYKQKFGRNSIDDVGMDVIALVHYDTSYDNAFWDGMAAYFGDGKSGHPLTALDIVGHEFSHGVTQFTSGLQYSDESGALNESFSDCMGKAVLNFARPGNFSWKVSGDLNPSFRDMSNPNAYNDPKFYYGQHWYTGVDDHGGVHTNSGVMNYWFYLLSTGKSGVNEINKPFNVPKIGIDVAARILYYAQMYYNSPYTEYAEMAQNTTAAAQALYGTCSRPYDAVVKAWYAVGLADTTGLKRPVAAGAAVADTLYYNFAFTNSSYKASVYRWQFGDGTTSNLPNPTHRYPVSFAKSGSVISDTVRLIAFGPNGCNDTAYIPLYNAWPGAPTTGITAPGRTVGLHIFPNPVENSFEIDLSMVAASHVTMELLDISGRRVARILDDSLPAGSRHFNVPCDQYADGFYWLRCSSGTSTVLEKLLIRH